MTTDSKTLFREKAAAYQDSQDRTKRAGIRTGLGIFFGSLVVFIVAFVIDFAIREITGYTLCILPVIWIGAAIGVPIGIGWTIVNAIRPTKPVTCPVCGGQHRVYRNVRKFMCPDCRALLLLGKNASLAPRLVNCPYCGLPTATTDDHGPFLCPNCGVVREPTGYSVGVGTQACPECRQSVPTGVIYCTSCGHILKDDFAHPVADRESLAYDDDWRIGKDALGHYYFAKALLAGIRARASQVAGIEKAQALMTDLEKALMSLEEALQAPNLRSYAEALVPEADRAYADLLVLELRAVQALDPKKRLKKDALSVIAKEPHIAARRRVEAALGAAFESTGSIGRWGEKLVAVEEGNNYSKVKSYESLRREVDRFGAWKEEQARAAIPPAVEASQPEQATQAAQPACPYCGNAVRAAAKFCNTCGAQLKSA